MVARTVSDGDDGRHRDGPWRRALTTLGRLVHPQITVTDPPAGLLIDWDVAVEMRDGVRLRVNVFRPDDEGPHPVLLCAHPYGKDDLPLNRRPGAATGHRRSTT